MIYIIRNTLDDIFSNVLRSDKDLYIGCELKTKKNKKYERKAFRVDKIYDILRLFTKSVGWKFDEQRIYEWKCGSNAR